MNNIKYNIIIIIFVFIFIGYFYLENTIFKYKKTKENFSSNIDNSNIKKALRNVFTNVKLINDNLEKIIVDRLIIQDLINQNKFIFNDIVKDINLKINLNKIITLLDTNTDLYNKSINDLRVYKNTSKSYDNIESYLSDLYNIFNALKLLNNEYKIYYRNSKSQNNYDITKNNIDSPHIIEKINKEIKILKHHDNIKILLNDISTKLTYSSLSENINNFFKSFINYEKKKMNY